MTVPLLLEHFDELISTPEDVEKINRAILQLAIQGKLIEQNPNDESADELLKRIEKVSNSKGSKSQIKITEDEHPFELPSGWKWARLGDLCRLENGDRSKANYPNKSVLVKEGIPFVNAGHLVNGRIDRNTMTFIPKEKFDKLRSGKFTNGDILFCLRGSLGKSAIVEGFDAGAIASSLVILKIYPYLSNYYLLNYFDSPLAAEMIKKYDNGTAQPNLSAASLAKFLVPLPPFSEQQRIVARIEGLFTQTRLLAEQLSHSRTELDRLNESALAHLLASETPEEFNERWGFVCDHFDLLTSAPEHIAPLRQSILELAVRGKLTRREAGDESARELLKRIKEENEKPFPPIKADEILFDLPDGWVWCHAGDLFLFTTSGSRGWAEYYSSEGAVFLRIGNLDYESIKLDLRNIQKVQPPKTAEGVRTRVQPGDVLVSITGDVGMTAVIQDGELGEAYINQHIALNRPSTRILPEFIGYCFISPHGLQQLFKSRKGIKNSLTLTDITSVVIPLPPLAEQERIVKRVEQLLGWCDALEAQLAESARERGRLVESVLAGVGI